MVIPVLVPRFSVVLSVWVLSTTFQKQSVRPRSQLHSYSVPYLHVDEQLHTTSKTNKTCRGTEYKLIIF